MDNDIYSITTTTYNYNKQQQQQAQIQIYFKINFIQQSHVQIWEDERILTSLI